MRIHSDWSTAAFELDPVAAAAGPFPGRGFLSTWWRYRGAGEVLLVESDCALLQLQRSGDTISFLGEADLTDYHSPLGDCTEELITAFVSGLDSGVTLEFDSLPGEVAEVMIRGIGQAGVTATTTRHEVAAVADLPATHEAYLDSLSGKQRHEVRRKRRRFVDILGEPRLVRDRQRFGEFVAMHRSAEGRKGRFMTPEMEKFFAELLNLPEATLDLLVDPNGDAVAAAFGFEDESAYYLYNSAYDSAVGSSSPGALLVDELIAGAIAAGRSRFDFLKGDEQYKFRLGGGERPLFRVEATR